MRNSKGVSLIEMMIAMAIITIASLGFLVFETDMFRHNVAAERNNIAYEIALDVAGRLQRMYDNSLILHTTNRKCVGVDSSAVLKECLNLSGTAVDCSAGAPTGNIAVGSTDMIKYTNPWNGSQLYLYDGNNCDKKTWVDSGCGTSVAITTAANANIDHPNAAGSAYNSINPVRSYRNTTYYAVWSVAYMPCNAGAADTSKRKIFVTVYWIVPEPSDASAATVQTKIANGTYRLNSVTVTADKVIGTES